MKLFALPDRKTGYPRPVGKAEALRLNAQNYGIFWVVNDFKGRRLADNLTRINYWFVEIDRGDKESQLQKLQSSPLVPSLIVESARGYHAYWRAKDATRDQWKAIVRWGLVEHFGSDPKCSDPLRLLRAPGYDHCKGEPLRVKTTHDHQGLAYTEAEMLQAFPPVEPKRSPGPVTTSTKFHVDARIGLPALNGSPLMKGECFDLVPVGEGRHNIIRRDDGLSTGNWVDERGLIGGNPYGSTLGAWLRWYGHSWRRIKETISAIKASQASEEAAGEEAAEAHP